MSEQERSGNEAIPQATKPGAYPNVILCATSGPCTCGAPGTTPRGMHHRDCGVRA